MAAVLGICFCRSLVCKVVSNNRSMQPRCTFDVSNANKYAIDLSSYRHAFDLSNSADSGTDCASSHSAV